jgi:hypothetical protein
MLTQNVITEFLLDFPVRFPELRDHLIEIASEFERRGRQRREPHAHILWYRRAPR